MKSWCPLILLLIVTSEVFATGSSSHAVGFGSGSLSFRPSGDAEDQKFSISMLDYRFRFYIDSLGEGFGLSLGLAYEASLNQVVKEQYEMVYKSTIAGGYDTKRSRSELFFFKESNPWGLFWSQRVGIHNYSIGIEKSGFTDIKGSNVQLTSELEFVYYDLFGLDLGVGVFTEIFSLPLSVDRVSTQVAGAFATIVSVF